MKTYTVKHVHGKIGYFNGALYFLVDNRLMMVEVGTPNFNDYNEWRMGEFRLSVNPHDPSTDEVELEPLDIKDFTIDENDLKFLELATKLNSMECELTDPEFDEFRKIYPDFFGEVAAVKYSDIESVMVRDSDSDFIEFDTWEKRPESEKTSFEKIFFPLVCNYRIAALAKHSK